MDVLETINQAGGWHLSLAGIGTVFVTLLLVWIFLKVFGMMTGGANNSVQQPEAPPPVEPEPVQIATDENEKEPEPVVVNDAVQSEVMDNVVAPLDDTLPRMAAAAAVGAYLNLRKQRILALLPKTHGQEPWGMSARREALYNQPPFNPWKLS